MLNISNMIVRLADLCEAEGRLLRVSVLDLLAKGTFLVIAGFLGAVGALLFAAAIIVLLTNFMPVWLAMLIPAIAMLGLSGAVLLAYRRSNTKPDPQVDQPLAELSSSETRHAVLD